MRQPNLIHPVVTVFAEAIAHFEGFYDIDNSPNAVSTRTIAWRQNNPGNLRSWGSTTIENGFASFAKKPDGWAALYKQVEKNLFERRLSIFEFFAGKEGVYPGYAPVADYNDPANYANFVARFLEDRGYREVSINYVIAAHIFYTEQRAMPAASSTVVPEVVTRTSNPTFDKLQRISNERNVEVTVKFTPSE